MNKDTVTGIIIAGIIFTGYNLWRHEDDVVEDIDNFWKKIKEKRGYYK